MILLLLLAYVNAVRVHRLSGEMLTFEKVLPTDTVAALKRVIEEEIQVPKRLQRLTFDKRILHNHEIIPSDDIFLTLVESNPYKTFTLSSKFLRFQKSKLSHPNRDYDLFVGRGSQVVRRLWDTAKRDNIDINTLVPETGCPPGFQFKFMKTLLGWATFCDDAGLVEVQIYSVKYRTALIVRN